MNIKSLVCRNRSHVLLYAAAIAVGFSIASGLGVAGIRKLSQRHPAVTTGAQAESSLSPENLSSFADFPLFSVGDEYNGIPLTRVIRHKSPADAPHPENLVILMYGDCTPPSDGGGCAVPLSIRIEPVCDAPPSKFAAAAFSGPPLNVRGATARTTGGHLQIWTETVSISVYAASEATRMDAAGRLANINAVPVTVSNAASTPIATAIAQVPLQAQGMFAPQVTSLPAFAGGC